LGRELISQLARQGGADRIVTMSRDEHKRAQLQAEYSWHPGVKVYAGDVRDEKRMRDVFKGCEVVVHAAARKVVCGHYDEPREHHLTNVVGTANALSAARHAGVGKFLFISSDKACAPINVYGVSKSLAEGLVISENARCFHDGLRCGVIRYGNVLASNGSVVQVWRKLAEKGTPLPISDRRMTRFWVPLPVAAGFVRRAYQDLRGGEVLVPKLKAAPLTRLLRVVAPGNSDITEIGIRPGGEKMHEILLDEEELRRVLETDHWYVVPPAESEEAWETSKWLGERPGLPNGYCSSDWKDQWSVEELREVLDTRSSG
jgi:UDP-N-acetylglucosamine 4,6-dehydratase